jgi:hypothetical protein
MFMKRRTQRRKQRRKRVKLARKAVLGRLRRVTLVPSKLARRTSRREKT